MNLRFLTPLLSVLLGLLLLTTASAQSAMGPTIIVSMHPHYDLVRQIVGEEAEVVRLLPIGASPHTFDPTPRDVARISEADLVVFNGGLDEWLHNLVAASGTDAPMLELLEVLEFEPIMGDDHAHEGEQAENEHSEEYSEEHSEEYSEEQSEEEHHDDAHQGEAHDEDEHAHDGEHADVDHADDDHADDEHAHDHSGENPHVWLDPVLMAEAVPLLVAAISEIDPDSAGLYEANGEALIADLEALHAELTQTLAPVEGAPFVPFHDAWPYFTARYGLNQVVVIEPSPGREPTPSYLAEALALIEASGAQAIFNEVQLPARPAEVLAEQAGVALYTLDPEGGGSSDDETYQEFMRENAQTIARALSQ